MGAHDHESVVETRDIGSSSIPRLDWLEDVENTIDRSILLLSLRFLNNGSPFADEIVYFRDVEVPLSGRFLMARRCAGIIVRIVFRIIEGKTELQLVEQLRVDAEQR